MLADGLVSEYSVQFSHFLAVKEILDHVLFFCMCCTVSLQLGTLILHEWIIFKLLILCLDTSLSLLCSAASLHNTF